MYGFHKEDFKKNRYSKYSPETMPKHIFCGELISGLRNFNAVFSFFIIVFFAAGKICPPLDPMLKYGLFSFYHAASCNI